MTKSSLTLSTLFVAGFLAFAPPGHAETSVGEPPGPNGHQTLSGSYLAGRSADVARDLEAAALYFSAALARDPDNPILLERVLVLRMANGEIDAASGLADRLIGIDRRNPLARLLRSVEAFKQGAYDRAENEITETAPAPLALLTSGLLSAWADEANGKIDDAMKTIDGLSGPSWYGIFKNYHEALIADLAGRKDEAVEQHHRGLPGRRRGAPRRRGLWPHPCP